MSEPPAAEHPENSLNGEELQTDKGESQEQVPEPETPSELDLLRTQLTENPHDPDRWRKLVELAELSGDIEKVKDAYEALLTVYPNTVRCQLS